MSFVPPDNSAPSGNNVNLSTQTKDASMKQTALLLIDLQQEYATEGLLPLENIDETSSKAAQLLAFARHHNYLVIHIHHVNRQAKASYFKPDSIGVKVIQGVEPKGSEAVIIKHRPNAFVETDLQTRLSKHGITNLVIAGAMSHMCIEASTRAAVDIGLQCTVIENACTTRELEFNGVTVPAKQVHAASMAALAFAYAEVVSYEQYIAAVD